MHKFTSYVFVLGLFLFTQVFARPFRPGQIPNGSVNKCANCHINPLGGGERNAFGKLVEARFLTAKNSSGNVLWGPELASLDADGDGVTNGEELQDPYGLWQKDQPAPGDPSLVTLPGDAASNPNSTATVHFTNMTPHLGQKLELRAIDIANGKEIYRETVPSVITADFDVTIDSIVPGHSYMFDFFADFNKNGKYDTPPVDHAWRLFLMNAQGNDVVNFTHNTKFTDIKWPSLLTVQFIGMTPHLGQLLELRILDETKTKEIGRTRIESVSQADFSINIPVAVPAQKYYVDFYADFNKNKLYNTPPADHAWEISVDNVVGDTTVTFTHNTNFTDINWKYNFTINFVEMNPHIGEKFELRLVRQSDGTEIGRVSLDSVLIPEFSISVPGIEPGQTYNADFYSDFNRNGQYDPPPVDHAYRVTFTADSGNHIENFSHNTNFTDINWPGFTTDVNDINIALQNYSLDQNYPNPFNPTTIINYNIPAQGKVTLKIFNVLGKEVSVLVDREQSPGNYSVNFNGAGLPSGIYLYELRANNFVQAKKMLLLK